MLMVSKHICGSLLTTAFSDMNGGLADAAPRALINEYVQECFVESALSLPMGFVLDEALL